MLYIAKGRKKAEEHLPQLLEDIKNLVDAQSQTDPSFKTGLTQLAQCDRHPVVQKYFLERKYQEAFIVTSSRNRGKNKVILKFS